MPFQTEAFVVESPGAPLKLVPVTLDDPSRGEVLIQMVACGICLTDLHTQNGVFPSAYPCMLGHEGAGVVTAIGEGVTRAKVGDKVLLSFSSCQECKICSFGSPASCIKWTQLNFGRQRPNGSDTCATLADGRRVHGTFFGQSSLAKHALVVESSIVVVPASTDLIRLAPLGCGMQTGSGALLNVLKPAHPDKSSVVIFGAGAVGLAALFAAVSLGFKQMVMVDLLEDRLALARGLGATDIVFGKDSNVADQIIELTDGGADYVIEATGAPPCIKTGWASLGPRGRMVQLGSPGPGPMATIPIHDAVCTSKTYYSLNQGDSNPPRYLPVMMKLHEQGKFPLEKISKVFRYQDLEAAIAAQHDGSVIKPIISFV